MTDEGFSKLCISAAIKSATKSKLMNYVFFFELLKCNSAQQLNFDSMFIRAPKLFLKEPKAEGKTINSIPSHCVLKPVLAEDRKVRLVKQILQNVF